MVSHPPSIFEQLGLPKTNPYPYLRTLLIYPVLEEFLYRGLIYGMLDKLLNFIKAKWLAIPIVIVIQASLFSLGHAQYTLSGMSVIFFSGLMLGTLRCISKGILPCVIAHSLLNLMADIQSLL